jgi:hypothetical protein
MVGHGYCLRYGARQYKPIRSLFRALRDVAPSKRVVWMRRHQYICILGIRMLSDGTELGSLFAQKCPIFVRDGFFQYAIA